MTRSSDVFTDTLCKTYVKKASTEVGSAAAGREDKKVEKYSNLSDNYHFVPVGVETSWHLWSSRHQQIGKTIQEATSKKLSTLESGINIQVRLLIFEVFSRGYVLITGGYFY